MSFRYIVIGSLVLAPSSNAAVGDVGPNSDVDFLEGSREILR
jgi:hypothetical protein